MIVNNNDYVNAYVIFIPPNPGPNAFPGQGIRVITGTTNTNQQFTVTQAYPVPPVAGNTFAVTASDLAGTGQSTFVTDSGPSVNTLNHFNTVVTDFTTQVGFLNGSQSPEERCSRSAGGRCRWAASAVPSRDPGRNADGLKNRGRSRVWATRLRPLIFEITVTYIHAQGSFVVNYAFNWNHRRNLPDDETLSCRTPSVWTRTLPRLCPPRGG